MKKYVVLILVLVVAGTLYASGTSEKSASPQQVRMWTFLNPEGATSGRNLALKKIIDSFQAQNPGISIVVEPQQWDVMTSKFIAAAQAGTAPDIQWVIQDQLGEAISAGTLEPLENLLPKSWFEQSVKDINDAFWDFGARNGQHYQISLSRNYIGIMYRKDLFSQMGIATPVPSIEQLVADAQKLTGNDSKTGAKRYGLGQAFSRDKADPPLAASLILARQGTLFTKDGKADWATSAGQAAVQATVDMIEKYGITPKSAVSKTAEDLYNEFSAGHYAMIMGAGVRMTKVRSEISVAKPDDVGFMLIPGIDGKPYSPSVVSGWSVGVWSGSKVKEAAGKFLEAMVNANADQLWVTDGGQVPVRKSTLTSLSSFFSKPDNNYLQVMAQGFSNAAYALPTEFATGGWRGDLNAAIQDVLVNGTPVAQALEKTAQDFNKRTAN